VNEIQKEIVKEVIKEIPIKDIYDDSAKSSVKAVGNVVALLPRAINAAFEPLHKWILQREYNIDEAKKLLELKLEKISPDLITPPDQHIGIPVLQALSESMDSDELRIMYTNLLASSMVSGTKENVHPSYVHIIRQLSPDEALVFKALPKFGRHVPTIDITKTIKNREGLFLHHSNSSLIGYEANCKYPQNISQYINNLCRLGIAEIPDFYLVEDWRYERKKDTDYFKSIVRNLKHYEITKKCFGLTSFGNEFRQICIVCDLSAKTTS